MITTEEMKVNQLRIDGETLRDDVHQLKLSLEEATAKERRLKVMHEEVESLMKESEYIASRQRLIKVHRETIKAIELELVNLNARIQNFNNNASDKKSIEKN